MLLFLLACASHSESDPAHSGDTSDLPEITLDFSSIAPEGPGELSFSGILSFAEFDPENPYLELFIHMYGGPLGETPGANEVQKYTTLPEEGQLRYTITGLSQGNYWIGGGVLLTEFGFPELVAPGDLYGFYPGTVENPVIFGPEGIETIELTESSEGFDFGLGVVPEY